MIWIWIILKPFPHRLKLPHYATSFSFNFCFKSHFPLRVESADDPTKFFRMNYMDIVVVPAHFGKYRIVNEGVGVVTIHKTMLKPEA